MQETFFNIDQVLVIGGCALVVVVITSIIHQLVGKITRWWSPKWASFLFSVVIGGVVQFRFVGVLEPFHVVVMVGNVLLIFFAAVGINAVVGKPIELISDIELKKPRGIKEKSSIPAMRETWRTRWFE